MQNTHCIELLESHIAPAALSFSRHDAEVFDPISKEIFADLAGMPDGGVAAMAMAKINMAECKGPAQLRLKPAKAGGAVDANAVH